MAVWTPLAAWLRGGQRPLSSRRAGGPGRYQSAEEFREVLFDAYGFTPEAAARLRAVRLQIHDLSAPRGGGGWYGPQGMRIVLNGVQAEAAIHEYAHAWADMAGIYTEFEPSGPPWPTRNSAFRAAVQRAAHETAPRYARVRHLAHQYEFGDPSIDFPGMGDNDPERYAGLASGVMADIRLLPPYLRPWYESLFTGRIAPHAPRP